MSSTADAELIRIKDSHKTIVALAADYGNLGDVAITYAQERFLESCFPGSEIIDFPISSTFTHLKALKRIVTPDDVITITGGGNMGDLHHSIEDCRRFVIGHFPKNRIISFPQTMDFSDTPEGQRELNKTIRTYSRHKNLHLCAREPISFKIMQNTFPLNRVHLVPDIVLSLNQIRAGQKRHGVLLCIRKDNESSFSSLERTAFLRDILSTIPHVLEADTHIGGSGLALQVREAELHKMWDLFRSVQVVITDRLHGMIFAAITGTPCIAIPSANHKIRATYEAWLRSLPHITFQNQINAEKTIDMVATLKDLDIAKITLPDLAEQYQKLKSIVTGLS
ncbi:MAG: polysaccharide pyruvyl transferase family protein [Nitrospirae bacterium]|nr:polysaccharide pyruvyl transferase family protein [Nitrospirota bacterium]